MTWPFLGLGRFPRRAKAALAARADEFEDLLDDGMSRKLLCHVHHALPQPALGREQRAISSSQVVDVGAREAATLQPDDVEARQMRAVAERHAVGDEVVLEPRHTAEK